MEQVEIFNDIEELTAAFIALLKQAKATTPFERKCSVALSGGSTPKAIFREIVKKYIDDINWSGYEFYWVDERCVPSSDPESNYGVARRLFFDNINEGTEYVFPIDGVNIPEDEMSKYAHILALNLPDNNGFPAFDIVFLGVGDDGHTASIFPNQMELLNTKDLCAIATHPISGQKRITLTGRVLNNSRCVAFIVTGSGKKGIVNEIITPTGDFEKYPASFIHGATGSPYWLLDKAAASELQQ